MIYVLSDTYRQAEYCARTIFKTNLFKHIVDKQDLQGLRDISIFVYGEYYETFTDELKFIGISQSCRFYRIYNICQI